MSNYKRKLRSGKILPEKETTRKEEIDQDDLSQLECPRTPPSQAIEPYFPPSPFGRKRYQPHGDR